MNNQDILEKTIEISKANTFHATYAAFVDFSRPANEHRFFLINVPLRKIEYEWFTSHGKGSGELNKAVKFSNIPNSRMSSLGLYTTNDVYNGKYGPSLRLVGKDKTNDNAERRHIVMHRSNYVSTDYMRSHPYPGRSWGCITLDPKYADENINKLREGSIVFAYADGMKI